MREPERQFWHTIKNKAPRGWWLQRVENGTVIGMPDSIIATEEGKQVWVELKATRRPVRGTTLMMRAMMRREQVNWHLRAAKQKVKSLILARDDQGVVYMFNGAMAAVLATMTYDQCCGFRCSYDDVWKEVAQ